MDEENETQDSDVGLPLSKGSSEDNTQSKKMHFCPQWHFANFLLGICEGYSWFLVLNLKF